MVAAHTHLQIAVDAAGREVRPQPTLVISGAISLKLRAQVVERGLVQIDLVGVMLVDQRHPAASVPFPQRQSGNTVRCHGRAATHSQHLVCVPPWALGIPLRVQHWAGTTDAGGTSTWRQSCG